MRYSYRETSRVPKEVFDELRARLEPERLRLAELLDLPGETSTLWYQLPEAMVRVPYDHMYGATIDEAVARLRAYNPAAIIVCGIGGSYLGTAALAQLLVTGDSPELLFADTVDTDLLQSLITRIESCARAGNTVILLIISKSGATIETRANGALLFAVMERLYGKRAAELTCIIADTTSTIHKQAASQGIASIIVPPLVGGRFSVFTAVGMVPLMLCGLDREAVWRGAAAGYESALKEEKDNPAFHGALIRYAHAARGATIHDTFIFGLYGRLLGEWYRQLMGESLGKRHDRAGRLVETGITPTVSVGSQDLHSVTQLYLAGPHDKTTTFVMFTPRSESLAIPDTFLSVGFGTAPTTHSVHTALCEGTKAAFVRANRPFDAWDLAYTAHDCGYFMAVKMVEIMYLAYLMDVNAFDQPQVELYKEEIRRRLS